MKLIERSRSSEDKLNIWLLTLLDASMAFALLIEHHWKQWKRCVHFTPNWLYWEFILTLQSSAAHHITASCNKCYPSRWKGNRAAAALFWQEVKGLIPLNLSDFNTSPRGWRPLARIWSILLIHSPCCFLIALYTETRRNQKPCQLFCLCMWVSFVAHRE